MDLVQRIREISKDFPTLKPELCVEIAQMARGLCLDDCYDAILVYKDELTPEEIKFAEQIWRRGRAIGLHDASSALFVNMRTKDGGKSALAYLEKMSGEFKVSVNEDAKKGFSFNIIMPDGETHTES